MTPAHATDIMTRLYRRKANALARYKATEGPVDASHAWAEYMAAEREIERQWRKLPAEVREEIGALFAPKEAA